MVSQLTSQFAFHYIGRPVFVGPVDITFNNVALFVMLASASVFAFFFWGLKSPTILPTRPQVLVERLYEFIYTMCITHIGIHGRAFVPLILTIFLMFLFGNLLGLIPYSMAFTSQITITLTMSVMLLIIGLTFAIVKYNLKVLILPADRTWRGIIVYIFGAPLYILMFALKLLSLAVRITINMVAGHLVLFVVAMAVFMLGILGIIPFVGLVFLAGLEIFIAIMQAYIFTILTCLFLAKLAQIRD